MTENLRATVAGADVEADGEPNLRVPVVGVEVTAEGQPNLRVPLAGADVEAGGVPSVLIAVAGLEAGAGGQPHLRAGVVGLEALVLLPPEPFMTTLTFPRLRGQTWPVAKKPGFNPRINKQASLQEVRSSLAPYPTWEFDLTFSWLAGGTDYNTLVDFFLQCNGPFANFLFRDLTDHQVRHGFLATADGTTLQWPLARAFVAGGFLEPVGQLDTAAIATFASSDVSVGGDSIAVTMAARYANNAYILEDPPETGDGPYFVVPGAGATLPAGLSAATPYWAINVGGDVVKLASTWLAATAGTPVTITSAGSGAFSLERGYSFSASGPEAHTVPATGPYTVTVTNAATFLSDGGVTIGGTPLVKVSGSPATGQYSVNVATGVYTFNAAQASAAAEISYAFQFAPSAYAITMPNQVVFSPAPAAGLTVTGDFDFCFVCRFLDNAADFSLFMRRLWELQKCDFMAIPQG